MSRKEKQKRDTTAVYNEIKLDIPADEVWTYQIEGLKAPSIGKPVENAGRKKVIVVITLLIAIGLSIFFSVRAVHSETYNYEQLEDGWQFYKFSNPGDITEITIDCFDGDPSKPITEIREYAFNCDDKLTEITVGKNVKKIDGKSFYSVWNLRNIHVDKDNPNYCDLDGVLYNKDMTEVICYPIDHDAYLREKAGIKEELWPWSEGGGYDDAYIEKVQTYKIPETVVKVGELAFNYANLVTVYLPEGLKTIETLAFFKSTSLANIITYNAGGEYLSLPEGLEYIGSDAFSYDQALSYMFIPSSVKYIGHHAFWDTCYKEDGEVKGVNVMNVALGEEEFRTLVDSNDHWLPSYDWKLLKKTIDTNYSATRQPLENK